jgi:hypothetical protein
MLIAAFYKSTRPGWAGMYNRLVRWWERGQYSHCELIFSDGMAASSSFMDGGVRFKRIEFNPEHWDFIELPAWIDESAARAWFVLHEGEPYDLRGNLSFAIDFIPNDPGKSFCSKALGAAIGMWESWRFGPNALAAVLRFIYMGSLRKNIGTE